MIGFWKKFKNKEKNMTEYIPKPYENFGLTPLQVVILSYLPFAASIFVLLSGIAPIITIYKNKSVGSFSAMPFIENSKYSW